MTNLDTAFRSLFEINMGIKPGETTLVMADGSQDVILDSGKLML